MEGATVAPGGWEMTARRRCRAQPGVVPTDAAKVVFAFASQAGPVQTVPNRSLASLRTAVGMANAYWANANAVKAGRAQVATKLSRARTTATTTETASMENAYVTSTTSVLTAAKVVV